MANEEQLAILKQGVDVWNKWREENPSILIDLSEASFRKVSYLGNDRLQVFLDMKHYDWDNRLGYDLRGINLSKAHLIRTDFFSANLSEANLSRANLAGANLSRSIVNNANLQGAWLAEAELVMATLSSADLRDASLINANLNSTNLGGADLRKADLMGASLVRTIIEKAKISGASTYGISVWDLIGEFEEEEDLVITPRNAPIITVDNIKVAQFVYLILNNEEIRDVINTLTSKSVLILGRFAIPDRKEILDALRNKLREYNLLPIVFDFDRPTDRDFTETIKTLAGLSYFVIADITKPQSSPLELEATVPDYQIPFVPIIQEGEDPFAMMVDLQKKYDWVLPTRTYSSKEALINKLKEGIIDPAMEKHNELKLLKAQKPDTVSLG